MTTPRCVGKTPGVSHASRVGLVLIAGILLSVATACTASDTAGLPATRPNGGPSSTAQVDASPDADAQIFPVPVAQWRAMREAGMVRPGCPVQTRSELRRIEVNHLDFDGEIERGYLVANTDTAESLARIFTKLFDAGFPIQRMEGVENYDGDTLLSLRANNTSSFNCRRKDQINAPMQESPHANGRAVDINPRQNPWRDLRCGCWSPGPSNNARTAGPGKILRGGVVWWAFRDEGWIWQNIRVADYMHFDTGYPSAALSRRAAR